MKHIPALAYLTFCANCFAKSPRTSVSKPRTSVSKPRTSVANPRTRRSIPTCGYANQQSTQYFSTCAVSLLFLSTLYQILYMRVWRGYSIMYSLILLPHFLYSVRILLILKNLYTVFSLGATLMINRNAKIVQTKVFEFTVSYCLTVYVFQVVFVFDYKLTSCKLLLPLGVRLSVRKLFTFQSPLKLLCEMEPSLAGSIYVKPFIKFDLFVSIGQQTCQPSAILNSDWLSFQKSSSLKPLGQNATKLYGSIYGRS